MAHALVSGADASPSVNLRYEVDKDFIAHFGASKTIGCQNYNVPGSGFGAPTCNATGCNVTGPNPNLKPLDANNADLSAVWYFARRSVASINFFTLKISGYVKTVPINRNETIYLVDPIDNATKLFFINSSSQQSAKIEGRATYIRASDRMGIRLHLERDSRTN